MYYESIKLFYFNFFFEKAYKKVKRNKQPIKIMLELGRLELYENTVKGQSKSLVLLSFAIKEVYGFLLGMRWSYSPQ